jgi:hypothetical protein
VAVDALIRMVSRDDGDRSTESDYSGRAGSSMALAGRTPAE